MSPDLSTLTALFPNLWRASCQGVQCATRGEDGTHTSAIQQLIVECLHRQATTNVELALVSIGSAHHVHLSSESVRIISKRNPCRSSCPRTTAECVEQP